MKGKEKKVTYVAYGKKSVTRVLAERKCTGLSGQEL